MGTELTLLGWTLVLALLQLAVASTFRSMETGLKYDLGPRDDPGPPMRPATARLKRAYANLMETLPLFVAAVLAVHAAAKESAMTALACQLYLGARVVYVPLYAAGIPALRSLVWGVSMAGIVMLVLAIVR